MENRESVDQTRCSKRRGKRQDQLRRLLEHEAELLQTQGSVLESYRRHKGRRLGPYYKLSYRKGGRQRSLYLGADAELAEEARAALSELQKIGLYLKGSEVRGWRRRRCPDCIRGAVATASFDVPAPSVLASEELYAQYGVPTPKFDRVRTIAQWAVNAVDYRDTDAITTCFDPFPFHDANSDGSYWDCRRRQ